MIRSLNSALLALLLLASPALAAGSLPVALQTVIDINGRPQVGALLYFYQVGTVATRQDSFQDTGLTVLNQWPLPTDAFGRVPMFYLADGSVHVRLTDSGGGQIFDYPNMLVIGPSGGGGGGSSVDPTSVASTGDVKFRPTSEVLSGWVRLNSCTIGNAVSGAAACGRANADTQALFIYLWTNCPNATCPVSGGRGASGLADFNAAKTLTVPDMRGRGVFGVDDMGTTAAGRLTGALFTAGNATTPLSFGGEAAHTLTLAQAPTGQFTLSDPGHIHSGASTVNGGSLSSRGDFAGAGAITGLTTPGSAVTFNTASALTGVSISDHAGGQGHNVMAPFTLGNWHMKL